MIVKRTHPRFGGAFVLLASLLVAALSGCGTSPNTSSSGDDAGGSRPDSSAEANSVPGGAEASNSPDAGSEPASKPSGELEVGSSYSGSCTVAWPSAPTVTATDIQMTMSCSGLSSTYPLVLVVYPDPKLKVTGSTGAMRVEGKIQDFGENATMGKFPIIVAASIELP